MKVKTGGRRERTSNAGKQGAGAPLIVQVIGWRAARSRRFFDLGGTHGWGKPPSCRARPENRYARSAAVGTTDEILARLPQLHSVSAVVTREAAAILGHLDGIPGPLNPAGRQKGATMGEPVVPCTRVRVDARLLEPGEKIKTY